MLVITCFATKFSMAIPLRDRTAVTVARAFVDFWIADKNIPEKLITDGGP